MYTRVLHTQQRAMHTLGARGARGRALPRDNN